MGQPPLARPASGGFEHAPVVDGYPVQGRPSPQLQVPVVPPKHYAGQLIPMAAQRVPVPGERLPVHPAQQMQMQQQQQQRPGTIQAKPQRRVGLDGFNFSAVLGKGNFGKVMLAEEKSSSILYAIKVLKKEFIIDNNEVESGRTQFANMVKTCHTTGVQVIADTIFNHMTGVEGRTGVGRTSFTHFNLATDTSDVPSKFTAYANDIFSLGVDGLRLDIVKKLTASASTAPDIAASNIKNFTTLISKQPYIKQEVIWGPDEPIQPTEYVGIGWVPSKSANVFVMNHDTERVSSFLSAHHHSSFPLLNCRTFKKAGDSLNYTSPSNTYTNALIFSLAHPYGRPTVLSSYKYSGRNDGVPNNAWTAFDGDDGFGHDFDAPIVERTEQQRQFTQIIPTFVCLSCTGEHFNFPFIFTTPQALSIPPPPLSPLLRTRHMHIIRVHTRTCIVTLPIPSDLDSSTSATFAEHVPNPAILTESGFMLAHAVPSFRHFDVTGFHAHPLHLQPLVVL
ncbi:hypothetical protein EW146_g8892 [Bondarzewia mesenterica]|uniref:Protein kinase domain-containing protein n=1 Tax=Bondarzewia mesenterica TaxID=1095465 RepID=A0A4S4LAM0_9AGAM|nr:hypothetical protein EW146_g8892 [Bondarzewia mesenterica]